MCTETEADYRWTHRIPGCWNDLQGRPMFGNQISLN